MNTMSEEIRSRNEIEEKYKWDLTHIFKSDEEWEREYNAVMAETDLLEMLNGHVA